jgi:hypothetical protein
MGMLQTFESDVSQFDPRNPYKGDEKLPVQFYMGCIPDDAATEKEGRPIYRDVECIKIYNSKDNIIDRPVRDTDKKRWPGAYAAWKQSGESEPGASGTRLEHWPLMTRAQVEEYKFFKVFTVEQLAELPDSTVQKIMGAPKLKQLARLAVEAARGDAPFQRLQGEIEKRDGQIAELTAEVRRLTQIIEERLTKVAA